MRVGRTVATFHLVLFAWIFFRAETLGGAVAVIRQIVTDFRPGEGIALRGFDGVEIAIAAIFVTVLEIIQLAEEKGIDRASFSRRPPWVRWTVYYAALFVILFFGRFDERQFIYFQF